MAVRVRPICTVFFVLVLVTFSGAFVWAGGSQEQAPDHHHEADQHHDGGMAIPHIEAVDLASGERLQVIASTSIIGDVVRQVAGDAAEVTTLMPIGGNPHAYQPTPRATGQIEHAHLVFVNGLDLEKQLMGVIEQIATGYVVPVSAGIRVLGEDDHDHDDDNDDDDDHDDDHAGGDPHFWFSPRNVIVWTENIAHALSDADPRNREIYHENADAYINRLEILDAEIRTAVSRIPRRDRKLVVDHVALTYFAAEYGFEIIGEVIPVTSDQAEPSARHIAELTHLVRDENAKAIVVGGTANRGLRNLVRAVVDEVGQDIRIGEILTGSLAARGNRGDTYLDYMRYNTEQIANALLR